MTGLDKHRAHLRLARAGLPVPDTILLDLHSSAAAAAALAEWGRTLLKPRRGSFGQDVLQPPSRHVCSPRCRSS